MSRAGIDPSRDQPMKKISSTTTTTNNTNNNNTASSVGIILLLLAALLGHEALGGADAYGCVRSATFCLCESSDPSVSAAGMAVLDAGLSHSAGTSDLLNGENSNNRKIETEGQGERSGSTKRGQSSSGADGVWAMEQAAVAGRKAAASSRVLAAVESLLALEFHEVREEGPATDSNRCVSNRRRSVLVRGTARLDGCGFGLPLRGVLDAPVNLLAHVISGGSNNCSRNHLAQQKKSQGLLHLWPLVFHHLRRGGYGELSPTGLASALRFVAGVLLSPGVDVSGLVLEGEINGAENNDHLLGVVCGVLARSHLKGVAEWPEGQRYARRAGVGGARDGGMTGVAVAVLAAVGVLQASLSCEVSREALLTVQQEMYARDVVAAVLEAMRVLSEEKETGGIGRRERHISRDDGETDGEEDEDEGERGGQEGREGESALAVGGEVVTNDALCACVDVLSRLVLLSSHFTLQFIEQGGLADLVSAGGLWVKSPPALLTGALVIASQLARASVENYARLRAAGIDSSLRPLLAHPDPTVRAKACNLVGNLCRHSAFFYPSFLQEDEKGTPPSTPILLPEDANILKRGPATATSPSSPPTAVGILGKYRTLGNRGNSVADRLVGLCADADASARKFACFAVGNAAFHNDELYAGLAPAVEPLVHALEDAEEKTRANAAGALGNLVRNSGALSADLAQRGGVAALLRLAVRDAAAAPRRIALFSLGTCCVYAPCREALVLVDSAQQGTGYEAGGRCVGSGSRLGRWDGQGDNGSGVGGESENLSSTSKGFVSDAGREGIGEGLERRLRELERDAAGWGDDVSRKYVARLRNKLSGPPQA